MLGDRADAHGSAAAGYVDIAPANVHSPTDGGFEHIAAAKQRLKLRGPARQFRGCAPASLMASSMIVTTQRRTGRTLAAGQHVMTHAADQQSADARPIIDTHRASRVAMQVNHHQSELTRMQNTVWGRCWQKVQT